MSGVAATILGFLCATAWDLYKLRRDVRAREDALVRAIRAELVENRTIVTRNVRLLTTELAVLDEGKSVVEPLLALKVGVWDVVKIQIPKFLFVEDRLPQLRDVISLAEQCNEQIRSRESWRMHNAAMDNYARRLKLYDESLFQSLESLRLCIETWEKTPSDSRTRS